MVQIYSKPEFPISTLSLRKTIVVLEDAIKPSSKDQAEGKFHEVKGKIKEKVGKATNNPDLEVEGKNETTVGKIQKKIGQVEQVLGD